MMLLIKMIIKFACQNVLFILYLKQKNVSQVVLLLMNILLMKMNVLKNAQEMPLLLLIVMTIKKNVLLTVIVPIIFIMNLASFQLVK